MISPLSLEREDVARWDDLTRVAVDFHLERGTIWEVLPQAAWDAIDVGQRSVHPFFIVGRALEQRRKGHDDFRIRPVEGTYEDWQQHLLAHLIAAFHDYAPAGGQPRALVVPRSMLQRLIGSAMVSALNGTLSFRQVRGGHPQMMFLGIPVVHDMGESTF